MEWEGEGKGDGDHEKENGGKKGRRRGLKVEFEEKGQGCWERERLDKARWKEAGLYVV